MDGLAGFIALIIPGFISYLIFDLFYPRCHKKSAQEETAHILALSLFSYGIYYSLADIRHFFSNFDLLFNGGISTKVLLGTILISIFTGLLWSKVYPWFWKKMIGFLKKSGDLDSILYYQEIERPYLASKILNNQNNMGWYIVELKTGKTFQCKIESISIPPDKDGITIDNVSMLNKKDKISYEESISMIYIPLDEISYIMFVKDPEEESKK